MKRVIFDDCVGWLHEAAGSTGVVMCTPIGHETMWSHRALRHLADDLVNASMPVLRFDYPGTGDSGGVDEGPDCVARWVHSIVRASQELRSRTDVKFVVLCGLRLGATLAVLAAEAMAASCQAGVTGLVLLAPPVSGRVYLRELRALHANWLNNAIPDIPVEPLQDGSCEVLGYRLAPDTVSLLESLRLDRRSGCPAAKVLLLDAWPGDASPVTGLGEYCSFHPSVPKGPQSFGRYWVAQVWPPLLRRIEKPALAKALSRTNGQAGVLSHLPLVYGEHRYGCSTQRE